MLHYRPRRYALALIGLLLVLTAFAVPPAPQGLVFDSAHLLSDRERNDLESQLRAFEAETSNQIVVATFPSLEDEALEDLTIRIAEAWKPGQKERNNGAILFIFKAERKLRIEVGYGLEGVLPDALAKRIISQEIAPAFKRGDYEGGIKTGVQAMMAATQGEYAGAGKQGQPKRNGDGFDPGAFVLLFIFLLIAGYYFFPAMFLGGIDFGPHRRSSGSWGGGGFGGFGGGSFGGGGASGDW